MNPTLTNVKAFDIANSTVSLWVFKRSTVNGQARYKGRWIELDDDLDQALKIAAAEACAGITETIDYGILAQNNESSAMTLPLDETNGPIILGQVADETADRQVKNLKEINNTDFYVVKFTSDGAILYGIRKTDDSWKAKKSAGFINVIFQEDRLALDKSVGFNVSKYFDFFSFGGELLISSKSSCESILAYKQGHMASFAELQQEDEFSALFADVGPIKEFVGENKIQLRRAAAIRQKGHYKDAAFMGNLRKFYKEMKLDINFDANGKIVVTPDNCRDVFIALLDHRLDSRLSSKLYDVQNTEDVPA